ncbi:endoribonuclease L-PSP [Phlyctema vagabunda]|uniref:Endoribonuclease L-PSP n=1 Tax=Phlyctema vagabunda TaxID=108571 RepID=A0ABR4P8W0_9HELO
MSTAGLLVNPSSSLDSLSSLLLLSPSSALYILLWYFRLSNQLFAPSKIIISKRLIQPGQRDRQSSILLILSIVNFHLLGSQPAPTFTLSQARERFKMIKTKSNRFSRAFTEKVTNPFRRLVSSEPKKESQRSFSSAVVSGEWVFVSAINGFHPATNEISPLIEEQCEQIFQNIQRELHKSGASMQDIVRVRYVLRDTSEWRDCWPVLRKYLGHIRPASSVMQAGLLEESMRIEIEVTARKMGLGYAD